MRALILPIGLLTLVGVAASAACSVTFSLPAGGVAVTPYGSCDTVDGYAVITGVTVYSDYCGTLSCSGTYYALCNGDAWAGCDCTIPSGFTEIGWSDFGSGTGSGDGGSGDTGAGDTGAGDTGSGETGSGDTGSGDTGSGDTGSGPDAGSGTPDTGSGTPDTGSGGD
jgi:hypothetical protein